MVDQYRVTAFGEPAKSETAISTAFALVLLAGDLVCSLHLRPRHDGAGWVENCALNFTAFSRLFVSLGSRYCLRALSKRFVLRAGSDLDHGLPIDGLSNPGGNVQKGDLVLRDAQAAPGFRAEPGALELYRVCSRLQPGEKKEAAAIADGNMISCR